MGNRTILVTVAILFLLGLALGYLIGIASSPSSQATMTTSPGLTHTTETTTTSTSTVTLTQTPTFSTATCPTPTSSFLSSGIEYLQIIYAYSTRAGNGWEIELKVENKGTADATIDGVFVNGVPINFITGATINPTVPLSVKTGTSLTLKITLTQGFSAGQQVEIKLHTASGKEYPKMVTLP